MYNNKMSSKKPSLFPIFFTVFIDIIGIGILIPVLAPLFLDPSFGILPANTSYSTRTMLLGFLISSFTIFQFFGAPILGALSDRHGRKEILLLSLIGNVFGYIIFALGVSFGNIILLYTGRILNGFAGGNISIAMAAIADVSDEKEKTKNFALIGMAFGLGLIFGPFIGGKTADPSVVSWFTAATPFWIAALLAVLNIIFVIFQFQETLHTQIHTPINALTGFRNIYKAFQLQNVRTILLVMFFYIFGFNFFALFYQVFMIDRFHFTQSDLGSYYAYVGLTVVITQGVITRLVAKRFTPFQVVPVSLFFLSVGLFLSTLPNSVLALYLFQPFISLFQGLAMPNTLSIISNLASKESQGEIMGINQSIQSLAFAVPPIISGFLVARDVRLPSLAAGISTLIALILYLLLFHKKEKEQFVEV